MADTCVEILNLIADLIDDRYKLKVKVAAQSALMDELAESITELQALAQRLKEEA